MEKTDNSEGEVGGVGTLSKGSANQFNLYISLLFLLKNSLWEIVHVR